MTSLMPSNADSTIQQAQKPWIIVNKLILKAINASNFESLKFIMLNDTVNLFPYDRAVLFDLSDNKRKLLGVSGQVSIKSQGEIHATWKTLAQGMLDPYKVQILTEESFSDQTKAVWNHYSEKLGSKTAWFPIFHQGKALGGMMLEHWNSNPQPFPQKEPTEAIFSTLLPGYGAAWARFDKSTWLKKFPLDKNRWMLVGIGLLLSLFVIRVPLRIVAPCEVVPKDPIILSAPLEGIIERVLVNPGQEVAKGEPVVEYDKRVPLQDLKVAQKEVEITQADANRAMTLGLRDKRALSELTSLNLKLEKAKVKLDLAKYHASLLTVKAPEGGIVSINNPEEFSGKPVRVGEKLLTISNPSNTKVRIWIPESDNIVLDPDKQIKVFLNISPERGYAANLIYIGNESTITEKHLPSFVAEANWETQPANVKLGLKGTAVLYGEKVSLFYFLVRKPWGALRHLVGL